MMQCLKTLTERKLVKLLLGITHHSVKFGGFTLVLIALKMTNMWFMTTEKGIGIKAVYRDYVRQTKRHYHIQ